MPNIDLQRDTEADCTLEETKVSFMSIEKANASMRSFDRIASLAKLILKYNLCFIYEYKKTPATKEQVSQAVLLILYLWFRIDKYVLH
jgi:hypothetical protein